MKLIKADLSYRVMGAAIEVHRALGPGLLESMYHRCFERELKLQGLAHESHLPLPLEYKGLSLDGAYEADVVVERKLVVELKAVERLLPIHEAQLLTYMKLLDIDVGYLLNFNVRNLMRDGSKRFVL